VDPYGDEITSRANDREKFGTYTRDSYTGLDYADQRMYASAYGRFTTVDPSRKSGHLRTPLSWDRYSYDLDDPINRFDPEGLDSQGCVFAPGLSNPNCVIALNSVVQGVTAGIELGGMLGSGVATDGLSLAVCFALCPAATGQLLGQFFTFPGALLGNDSLIAAGNNVSNISGPVGAVGSIWGTGTGSGASDAASAVGSLIGIGQSIGSGRSPQPGDVAGVVSPISNQLTNVATNYLNATGTSSAAASNPYGTVIIFTPPVQVTGVQDEVPYALSGGGGGVLMADETDDLIDF